MSMLYNLYIHKKLDEEINKLAKKDKKQLKIINKKILQIKNNPYHFKPLKGDMKGSRRVHIGSFVLIYEIDEKNKIVRILDYGHHDNVY